MTGELFVCDTRRARGIGSRYMGTRGEGLENKEPYTGLAQPGSAQVSITVLTRTQSSVTEKGLPKQ